MGREPKYVVNNLFIGMNLLEKLKALQKDGDDIQIFVDNLDDVFISPSEKLIFHPHEVGKI